MPWALPGDRDASFRQAALLTHGSIGPFAHRYAGKQRARAKVKAINIYQRVKLILINKTHHSQALNAKTTLTISLLHRFRFS
jgi:hypothetical protein